MSQVRDPRGRCSFSMSANLFAASWQKGEVENANGRLRRWLPRQTDIDKVSDEEIHDIVITANLTPRKCLGFKTPFQAILKELGKDVQIWFA